MILINNKYSCNFLQHRKKIFLLSKKVYKTTKIENLNNFDKIFEQIMLKNKKIQKENYYPMYNNPLENLTKSKKITLNLEKINDFLNSVKIVNQNKILENIEFLSKIFQYTHIVKFGIEFFFLLCIVIYLFKKGTLY